MRVPDVCGMESDAAQRLIGFAGLTVGAVTEAYHDTIPAGEVISQDPPPWGWAARCGSVDLTVSLGPNLAAVPDVVGLSPAAAQTALEADGFTLGAVSDGVHATIAAGLVGGQSPEGGEDAALGSAVDLVVSAGNMLRVNLNTPAAAATQDGFTWDTAYDTIQEAVDVADAHISSLPLPGKQEPRYIEIWVAQGVYDADRSSDADGAIALADGIHLLGGFDGTETASADRDWETNTTTIDGANGRGTGTPAYHVLKCESVWDVIIDGFTITGGVADNPEEEDDKDASGAEKDTDQNAGGGIYCDMSEVTIANNIFTGNEAGYGAGVFFWTGLGTISDCLFNANIATGRGGGLQAGSSELTLTACDFVSNEAVDGAGAYLMNTSTYTLGECTFQGNAATNKGGGLMSYGSGARFAMSDCEFSGNTAAEGAGFYSANTSGAIENSTFELNVSSGSGGGMYSLGWPASSLETCSFHLNMATGSGGAIYSSSASPDLLDCVFTDNSAVVDGGGLYAYHGTSWTGSRCLFAGNTAMERGGAMRLDGYAAAVTLTNVVFSQNAAASGGGIYANNSSTPTIANCSFSLNAAGTQGGGIWADSSSNATLTNCILWGDTASQGAEIYKASVALAVDYSCVEGGYAGTANIGGSVADDPLYVDALNDDLRLQQTPTASPCIDSGTADTSTYEDLPADDILGVSRPQQSGYDMGAYEMTAPPLP